MLKKLTLLALVTTLLVACGSSPNPPPRTVLDTPPEAVVFPDYLIQPGDELDIQFVSTPELNNIVIVRPDGLISLPQISVIRAAGMTPEELDARLTEQYSLELLAPDINVSVKAFGGQKIYVGGEVKKPGVIEIVAPISAVEAAFMAGGFTDRSDIRQILIIRKGADRQPYAIRVNAGDALAGNTGPHQTLMATDIVYVPRSRIANAGLFVDQYIRQLLMFDGFRISFGYDLDDPSRN